MTKIILSQKYLMCLHVNDARMLEVNVRIGFSKKANLIIFKKINEVTS